MSIRNDWPQAPEGFAYGYIETPEERRELLELNKSIHNDNDAFMLKRLIEHSPGFGLENNFYLRDLDSGEMVACLNAIPNTWSYEGIEIRNLELGFVGTREDYRRRGLFDALYKLFNIELHAGEYDISSIQGIPFFYRKYGYDFMLPLNRLVSIRPDQLPFIVSWTILDTGVLPSQKRHWGELLEGRKMTSEAYEGAEYLNTTTQAARSSTNYGSTVRLCPNFLTLSETLRAKRPGW